MQNTQPSFKSWMLLVMLALIWGSSFILMKKGLESFSALQVASLRMLFGALCICPFVLHQIKNLSRKDLAYLFLSGWLGNGIPAILFTTAEVHISSSLAGLLNALTPIFALIFGYLIFKAPLTKLKVIGISIGFIGASAMMLLNAQGKVDLTGASYSLLILIATVCYGINVNVIRYKLSHLSALTIAGFALAGVGIGYAIALANTTFLPLFENNPKAWESLGYVSILGIFGTAISLVWFNQLVKQTSALFASMSTYLIPFVAFLWGVVAGEPMSIIAFAGLATILCGVYLVNKREPVKN